MRPELGAPKPEDPVEKATGSIVLLSMRCLLFRVPWLPCCEAFFWLPILIVGEGSAVCFEVMAEIVCRFLLLLIWLPYLPIAPEFFFEDI